MILSTNQRRGYVARISRDPFRHLVSFSVPQRRSSENEAKTGTAKSGSRPLLAVETQPVPHLCEPIRSAPCSGNAPLDVPRSPPQLFPISLISVPGGTSSGSACWVWAIHALHNHSPGPSSPRGWGQVATMYASLSLSHYQYPICRSKNVIISLILMSFHSRSELLFTATYKLPLWS